jgi:hypothetical protein
MSVFAVSTKQEAQQISEELITEGLFGKKCAGRFGCDAYYIFLIADLEYLIDQIVYWYGVFAHPRDKMYWKGFVQVPLSLMADEDAEAMDILNRLDRLQTHA